MSPEQRLERGVFGVASETLEKIGIRAVIESIGTECFAQSRGWQLLCRKSTHEASLRV
jgi:hypothetical protein